MSDLLRLALPLLIWKSAYAASKVHNLCRHASKFNRSFRSVFTAGADFAFLNSQKLKSLRADVANAYAARDAAEYRRPTQERDLKSRETAVAERELKISEVENKAAKAVAELAQLQKEKTELQTKLEANQNEIPSLQKGNGAGIAAKPSENLGAASTTEQQLTAPPPSPEIKPKPVKETASPPRRPKQQKTAPTKTPQVAGTPGTISISLAKALATYAPPPRVSGRVTFEGN